MYLLVYFLFVEQNAWPLFKFYEYWQLSLKLAVLKKIYLWTSPSLSTCQYPNTWYFISSRYIYIYFIGICTTCHNEQNEMWKPLGKNPTTFLKQHPRTGKMCWFFACCSIRYFILDCYYFRMSHAEELLLMEIKTHSKEEAFSILFLTVPSWRICQTQYNFDATQASKRRWQIFWEFGILYQ